MSTNDDKPDEKPSGSTPGAKPEEAKPGAAKAGEANAGEAKAGTADAADAPAPSRAARTVFGDAAPGAKDEAGEGAASGTDSAAAESGADGDGSVSADAARPTSRKKRKALPWLAAASVVILLAGIAGVVWKGIEYGKARDEQHMSEVRDQVLDVASQVVINSMSFTKDTVDQDQQRLREDSTGAFLAQQDEYADQIKQKITEQSATTKAEVSNSALTAIDDDLGTATVVLVYTATSERKDLPGVSGRQAARVELQREDDRWKVADLVPVGVQVPVGDSSQSVQGLDGSQGSGDDQGNGQGAGQGSGSGAAPSSAAKSPDTPASSKAPATSTAKSGGN